MFGIVVCGYTWRGEYLLFTLHLRLLSSWQSLSLLSFFQALSSELSLILVIDHIITTFLQSALFIYYLVCIFPYPSVRLLHLSTLPEIPLYGCVPRCLISSLLRAFQRAGPLPLTPCPIHRTAGYRPLDNQVNTCVLPPPPPQENAR